jgi:hypothetical protein
MDIVPLLSVLVATLSILGTAVTAWKAFLKVTAISMFEKRLRSHHDELQIRLDSIMAAAYDKEVRSKLAASDAKFQEIFVLLAETANELDSRHKLQILEALEQPSFEGRKSFAIDSLSKAGIRRVSQPNGA